MQDLANANYDADVIKVGQLRWTQYIDLIKLHQLLAGIRQLAKGEGRVQGDLSTQTRNNLTKS